MTYGLDLTEPRGLRMCRWTTAAVLIAVLHVAAALALTQWRDEEISDSSGSIALELAPMAAGSVSTTEQAPGPLMEEAPPTRQAAKRIKEVPQQTPAVEPSLLAPKPEVQLPVSREKESEKPKQRDPEAALHENLPQTAAAPMTTPPPPSPATLSPIPTTPAPGISASVAKAEATWRNELVSHINRYKQYPRAASAHRVHGVVTLEFTIDRRGHIIASRVTQSSGSALLDD